MAFHKKCSCIKCRTEISSCNINSHYNSCNTNTCLGCNTSIHSSKKFCNRSCAAKYNNSHRTAEQLKSKALSISKTLSTNYQFVCQVCEETHFSTDSKRKLCLTCSDKISPHRKRKYVNTRHCPSCNIKEISLGVFRHPLCPSCRTITEYRGLCNFTHDLRNYPDEYNLSLLEEHGMFHPKKNPKGVSRDHMYSIYDGYTNKIDPSIIKHPANCQVMLQHDNTIKHSQSSITFEELLERIRIWNEKYN